MANLRSGGETDCRHRTHSATQPRACELNSSAPDLAQPGRAHMCRFCNCAHGTGRSLNLKHSRSTPLKTSLASASAWTAHRPLTRKPTSESLDAGPKRKLLPSSKLPSTTLHRSRNTQGGCDTEASTTPVVHSVAAVCNHHPKCLAHLQPG